MHIRSDGKVFRSREEWRELIARFESSSQKGPEFCRNEGIAPTVLYKWRMKLRQNSEGKLELIEAKLPERLMTQDSKEHYEIRFKNGRALSVSQSFNPNILSELIRVVERC